MMPPRPTELAWMLLRGAIRAGDLVIDATAGNGYDTVFLAGCVGESGRVIAFDVQEAAIRSARSRVVAAGLDSRVDFHHASHAGMAAHAAAESVSVVMFNLGYLPGEDHGLTTQAWETLTAMEEAASLLKPGGVLSVVCYPGHAEGAEEAARVEEWLCARASSGWRVAKYGMPATLRPAPFLLLAAKNER
ncbi:MAG: class I SAM-dependent methyltransferase [Luteolibacter sp.]|jgi:predicted methyltransferase|nr:class I SAM-dependent methyltransferase [Luteolibacter sp.]